MRILVRFERVVRRRAIGVDASTVVVGPASLSRSAPIGVSPRGAVEQLDREQQCQWRARCYRDGKYGQARKRCSRTGTGRRRTGTLPGAAQAAVPAELQQRDQSHPWITFEYRLDQDRLWCFLGGKVVWINFVHEVMQAVPRRRHAEVATHGSAVHALRSRDPHL